MGLTIGGRYCINCEKEAVKPEQMIDRTVEESPKRGKFRIPFICKNCGADMAWVWFNNHESKYNWAVAYRCTNNDEPCYDENCSMCTGNGKGWWE